MKKVCTGECGKELEINSSNFHVHTANKKDGHSNICKKCKNKRAKKTKKKYNELRKNEECDYDWFGTGFGTFC